ncbi:hypothetical protein EPO15_10805 [bacterium]|nr:MAG: hypothetical protein EPO15_10805 [bacterium]
MRLSLAALSFVLLLPLTSHARTLGSAWKTASEETDAARTLRMARNASDRAYRLDMDLQMLRRSVTEAKDVLAQAAADPARRERLEFLLKFLGDAYPVQGDSASYVLDKVLWLKYELGKPAAPELPAVAAELVARIKLADASSRALRQDVDALKAALDAAPAAAGERSLWLAGQLADSAARLDVYTAYVVEKAKVLEKPAA